jgi:hypothetical protein
MTEFDDHEWWLDEDLRSLEVLDVSAERARRTHDACLAMLAARRTSREAPWRGGWMESLAATIIGLVYLAAAIRASLILMQL